MSAISIEQAQAELPELIDKLQPGQVVTITRNNQAIATLVGQTRQRQFGLGKGKLTIVREDDEHLVDFKEYMP